MGSVVNDDKAVSVDLEREHTYVVSSENNSEVACHSKDEIHVDRKPRSNERTRHSLKRSRSSRSSRSSSSNGSFSQDSSDDSDDEMENKFCNIMCDLVKKTGSIIGEQIIKNAELINKLQNTVDDLRKEVAELRKEESERNETKDRRSDSGVIRGNRNNSGGKNEHSDKRGKFDEVGNWLNVGAERYIIYTAFFKVCYKFQRRIENIILFVMYKCIEAVGTLPL